jgi:putative FmdB family regulatory protein
MPLYDYRCHQCGKTFEIIQKFSDEPLHVHEECGGEVERLISAPALQFKGTGWYVTDYAKAGKAPSGKASDKGSESKPDSKSADTKTESKAESKPAATAPASEK